MNGFVADTHAAIWYVLDQKSLSTSAMQAFESAAQSGNPVYLSVISLIEIRYLVEKRKLSTDFKNRLEAALLIGNAVLVVIPLTLEIARVVKQVPRTSIPEMPDRIIAATALHLKLPLITRDRKIQASSIQTVW